MYKISFSEIWEDGLVGKVLSSASTLLNPDFQHLLLSLAQEKTSVMPVLGRQGQKDPYAL